MGRICPNDLLIDKHHNSFGSFEFHWFPKQCGHTEGFLRWVFRGAVHSTLYHACAGFLMTLTAQKFLHLPFSTEVSHETVARRPLFRMVRFTSAPYWFFELNPFRVARVARSGFFDI